MDNQNTVTIYEYKLSKTKFVQVVHSADVIIDNRGRTKYSVYLKNLRRTARLTQDKLDVLHNGHIFSLSDDIERFKQIFVDYYDEQILEEKRKINRYRKNIRLILKERSN